MKTRTLVKIPWLVYIFTLMRITFIKFSKKLIIFCRYLIFIGDKIYNPFFSFYFRLTKEQFALINVSNLNNTLHIFIFHFTVGYHLLFLYCFAYKDCIEKMKKRYHYTQSISFLYTTKNDFIINPIIKPNGVWNTKVQIPLGLIFHVVIFLFMHTLLSRYLTH